MYRTQLKTFIDCVENNAAVVVTAKDGANVMELIDAVRDASTNGSRVFL
jgi:predicted dehydrogenase